MAASKGQGIVAPYRLSTSHPSRSRVGTFAIALLAAAGSAATGCSGGASDGDPMTMVAFARDFAGFRAWPSHTTESPISLGGSHIAGTRIVYINQQPAAGATAFPLGTLIVKNMQADGRLFARAKRGGGYNVTGAVDWEWFELTESATGEVGIKWRGFGPPSGETYAGDPQGGCNTCHVLGKANDYVLSGWLALDGSGVVGAGGFPGAGGGNGAGGMSGPGGAGSETTSSNGAGGAKGSPDVL